MRYFTRSLCHVFTILRIRYTSLYLSCIKLYTILHNYFTLLSPESICSRIVIWSANAKISVHEFKDVYATFGNICYLIHTVTLVGISWIRAMEMAKTEVLFHRIYTPHILIFFVKYGWSQTLILFLTKS